MDSAGQPDKKRWRTELLARRAAVTPAVREAESAALALAVTEAIEARTQWVAAYVPVGGEPGSTAMLDALRSAGSRVLLPVTGPPGPLDWAEYTGADSLRVARYGLLEPAGPTLSAAAIEWAGVVLVPALAVDLRGVRLGRGAGYYDRTLPAADPDAQLIAVVRDDELVDRLPEEPHDRRMGWALTPGGGLRRLAGN
ncbi:5-formyltetrahydrofolate cyclo-ligase [Nocardia transvalensis]|uniref:5-formyltetrahydrofolate cyclo-ligase n=1 Tax=Nocardia transvalensis TaxID=37333 RepID=UPI001895DDE1|nr:5-formyltetrahydrofolate cyclo-ligase [Nocardia transvalensis]MBF6330593.1 5-formyltetrahydrofolate cyclo-ligase [Nocardia transvalensis]